MWLDIQASKRSFSKGLVNAMKNWKIMANIKPSIGSERLVTLRHGVPKGVRFRENGKYPVICDTLNGITAASFMERCHVPWENVPLDGFIFPGSCDKVKDKSNPGTMKMDGCVDMVMIVLLQDPI